MIKKAFLEKIYEAATMRRWNDMICPVELSELDKQAHKMIIAYVFGKFEDHIEGFNWIEVIEGGLFEFLHRLVLTDLKPQVFYEIKQDAKRYNRLNEWVFEQLEHIISPLPGRFSDKFKAYFSDTTENINRRILSAAHFYATKWEFKIIEWSNPDGYEVPEIRRRLDEDLGEYYDLEGMKQLVMHANLRNFIDLCGQLRFQVRWGNIHMVPRISVLGHMLIVAILGYLFSLEIQACEKRCINNYFTGLFHDLPEVLTRDIVSPVKESIRGLGGMIKQYERKQMKKEVYALIPLDWHPEIKMFSENEFKTVITKDGKTVNTSSAELNLRYNQDDFNPRDGELVRAIDHLAAYVEAYLATETHQIKTTQLEEAKMTLQRKYRGQKGKVAGIDFAAIYADFR